MSERFIKISELEHLIKDKALSKMLAEAIERASVYEVHRNWTGYLSQECFEIYRIIKKDGKESL